jgi:hypothetical protein
LYLYACQCHGGDDIRLIRRETADGSIQYVLQDAQPPHLFVIRQETKTDAGYDMPVAAYYILDGTVYQSPSLYDVFYSRFVRYDFEKIRHERED